MQPTSIGIATPALGTLPDLTLRTSSTGHSSVSFILHVCVAGLCVKQYVRMCVYSKECAYECEHECAVHTQ